MFFEGRVTSIAPAPDSDPEMPALLVTLEVTRSWHDLAEQAAVTIESRSQPEQAPAQARVLPAPVKRAQGATKSPKKKAKFAISNRNRKLRHR